MDIEQAYTAAVNYANRRGPIMRIIMRLFTLEHRRALCAIYAFFRTADDLVDEEHVSLERFRSWRTQSQRPTEEQTDPLMIAWADIRTRYNIPLAYEQATLDSLEFDLTCHRYETLDELKKYCYGVATVPFLIGLSIVGLRPGVTLEQARPYIEGMGIAVQLTDVMLDINEDLHMGRIYIPRSELTAFNLTIEDIEARCYNESFIKLMGHFASNVRSYYAASWPVLEFISSAVRLALGLSFILYRTVLDEMEARDFVPIDLSRPGWKIFKLLIAKWPAIVWIKSANKYFR